MRLIRPVLGMLLLTIGLPALLAGGCLWAALRHRDAGGAYSAELQRLGAPGYAIVVPDVDRLLRDDASFARLGGTELRITALTGAGPAFVGLAPSADIAGYLRDVPYTEVTGVQVGTGELPISTVAVAGGRALPSAPGRQEFWTRIGGGALRWTPGDVPGDYSLVIMNGTGEPGIRLDGTVEARPGWLDPAAWGLLTLGAILLMGGVIVLTLPGRRREIVYVVEPSQVPDLMLAIGAPLPRRALEAPAGFGSAAPTAFGPGTLFGFGQGRKRGSGLGGAHRPRTLADAQQPVRPPALPQFAWPPTSPESAAGDALPPSPLSPGSPSAAGSSTSSSGTTMTAPAKGIAPNALTPVVPGALPIPAPSPAEAPSETADPAPESAPAAEPASAMEPSPVAEPAPTTEAVAAAGSAALAGTASAAEPAPPTGTVAAVEPVPAEKATDSASLTDSVARGAQTPAPGIPLSLLGETPAVAAEPAARPGRRRLPPPAALPEFHATAVGAWVAQTAPERARQTEAQAAAALAEAARTRAARLTPADQLIRSTKPALPEEAVDDAGQEQAGDDLSVPALPGADQDPQSPRKDGVTRRRSVWPAPVPRRVALLTGPNATDWSASGQTRMGGSRPSPKPGLPAAADTTGPDQPKTSATQSVATASETPGTEASEGAVMTALAEVEPASEASSETVQEDTTTPEIDNSDSPAAPSKPVPSARTAESQSPSTPEVAEVQSPPAPEVAEVQSPPAPEPEVAESDRPLTSEAEAEAEAEAVEPEGPSMSKPEMPAAEPQRPSIHEAETADLRVDPETEKAETSPEPAPARTPKQPEARTVEAVEAVEERSSIHAAESAPAPEASTGVQEPQAKAAAKPAAKRTAEPNRPLSRAQDRLAGTTAGRQSGSATARKAPAAWIKAAESVAARAAAQPTGDAATTEQADSAADASARPAAPARKPRPRTARSAAEKSTPKTAAKAGPAVKPEPATVSTEPTATEAASAQATAAELTAAEPTATEAAAAEAAGKSAPEAAKSEAAEGKAGSGTATATKPAPRSRGYLGEAAELLGTATEPKRRRAAPRRPKEAPDKV
ncbi:hypothetical protein GCM10010443_21830 [Actinoplanes cyaneus]|uniref:hypothetical protein n=1 Tax=Actinoplanes cyaneus TaxID=52696 RepID=UPI0031CE6DB5